jgi:predicted Na+-dependent transporter
MPAWLYTLGRVFTNATNIYIPFFRLILNLFTTIGPCLFGLFLVKLFPKLRPIVLKIAKPVTLFALLSFLALTLYVKYYVFYLVTWKQWLWPPVLPWTGFLISGIVAYFAKLPRAQIYTIAIETGIQNVGIAFLIVITNFPSPESDYAILPLITVSFLTTIPLWLLLIIITIKTKLVDKFFQKKKTVEINGEDEVEKEQLKEAEEN